jgi:hypothetical protein
MSAAASHNPPRLMRPRPTDATGWGWAFISLVVGLFFAAIFPPFALVLVAFPFCFLWQFKKWHADSSIVKDATAWCRHYYPDAGGTPVVDFMIAVAHDTGPQFGKWSPDTALDDLNWMSDDDQAKHWYPEALDRTQAWLYDVFSDAKIGVVDLSGFSGTTLGNVIDELIVPHKTG